jgi:hypothetical protein
MPLKLHCIFNEASVLPEVVRLVEKTAHQLHSKKKSAKVEDVYAAIREEGYEIDAESIAFAYQQVNGIMGRVGFSSKADVNKFGGAAIKKAIRVANEGDIVKSKIGNASVNTAVVNGIATTFSTLEKNNDVDKSRLFQLQELMRKPATSLLDKSGYPKPPKASFKETLEALFDAENMILTGKDAMKNRIKGTMNTIEEVWIAMQKDIATVSAGIKDKAQRDRFDAMTADIRSSSYDLLLGTRQADEVVKEILKAAGYVKTINSANGAIDVVNWNEAMSKDEEWREVFSDVLKANGFDDIQTQRIINKLEGNYTRAIEKQAENKLKEIGRNNNLVNKIDKGAVQRMVELRNAGIFADKNKNYLYEAFGFDIPEDIAEELSNIIADFEENTKDGVISNVLAEEVIAQIRRLLAPLGATRGDKLLQGFNDYMALRAASTISSSFNAVQNLTSGINASVLPTITAVIRTRNPKLILHFAQSWFRAFGDVAKGGVTIRDSKTVNALEQLQGRGGLSDRWTFDNAKGFFGYLKASLNAIAQVTATAADAANGTVIYHVEMVKNVRDILKARGVSGAEANRIIDDVIFGKDAATGKSNREIWFESAMEKLENQEGVIARKGKAKRIADELIWSKLLSHGISVDEIKAAQSVSLAQKSKNLGHEGDLFIAPSKWINAIVNSLEKEARKAKDGGDRKTFFFAQATSSLIRGMNMFVGGKANWAILTLENSPFGIALGMVDVAISHLTSKKNEKPLYKQELSSEPEMMQKQLAARRAIEARFERGIYGTFIQMALAAGVMALMQSDADDDDRSEEMITMFEDYMQDPDTRRAMDKALPMMLAAELMYAYDRKTNSLDADKLSNLPYLPKYLQSPSDLGGYVMKQVFDKTGIDRLKDSWDYNERYVSDEDERAQANAEASMRYIGQQLGIPYTAWLNITSNEVRVISNGFEPDEGEHERRKEEYKRMIESTDGKVDALLQGMATMQLVDFFKNKY